MLSILCSALRTYLGIEPSTLATPDLQSGIYTRYKEIPTIKEFLVIFVIVENTMGRLALAAALALALEWELLSRAAHRPSCDNVLNESMLRPLALPAARALPLV